MPNLKPNPEVITPETLKLRRKNLDKKLHYLENDPNYEQLRRSLEIDTRLKWLDERLGELRQNEETRLEHLSSVVEALDKLEAAIETEEFKQKYAVSEKILDYLRQHPEAKLEELKPADFTTDPNLQKPDVWANIVADARGGSQVKSLLSNPNFDPKDPKTWADSAGNKLQEAGSWIADGVKKHPEIVAAIALAGTAAILWKFGKKVWGTLAGAAAVGLGFAAWQKDLTEKLGEKAKEVIEEKVGALVGDETVKDAEKAAKELAEKAKKEGNKLKTDAKEALHKKNTELSEYEKETKRRAEIISEKCSWLDSYVYRLLREHREKPSYERVPTSDADKYLNKLESDPPQALNGEEKIWCLAIYGLGDPGVEIVMHSGLAILSIGGTYIWKLAKKETELLKNTLNMICGRTTENVYKFGKTYTEGAIFVGGVTSIMEWFKLKANFTDFSGKALRVGESRIHRAAIRGWGAAYRWPIYAVQVPGKAMYVAAEKLKRVKLLGMVNLENNRFLTFLSETGEKIGRFDLASGAKQFWRGGKWITDTTATARYNKAIDGKNLELTERKALAEKAIGERAKALRQANPALTEEVARVQALEELEAARAGRAASAGSKATKINKAKESLKKGAEKVGEKISQASYRVYERLMRLRGATPLSLEKLSAGISPKIEAATKGLGGLVLCILVHNIATAPDKREAIVDTGVDLAVFSGAYRLTPGHPILKLAAGLAAAVGVSLIPEDYRKVVTGRLEKLLPSALNREEADALWNNLDIFSGGPAISLVYNSLSTGKDSRAFLERTAVGFGKGAWWKVGKHKLNTWQDWNKRLEEDILEQKEEVAQEKDPSKKTQEEEKLRALEAQVIDEDWDRVMAYELQKKKGLAESKREQLLEKAKAKDQSAYNKAQVFMSSGSIETFVQEESLSRLKESGGYKGFTEAVGESEAEVYLALELDYLKDRKFFQELGRYDAAKWENHEWISGTENEVAPEAEAA